MSLNPALSVATEAVKAAGALSSALNQQGEAILRELEAHRDVLRRPSWERTPEQVEAAERALAETQARFGSVCEAQRVAERAAAAFEVRGRAAAAFEVRGRAAAERICRWQALRAHEPAWLRTT